MRGYKAFIKKHMREKEREEGGKEEEKEDPVDGEEWKGSKGSWSPLTWRAGR